MHLETTRRSLDLYYSHYKDTILFGDSNLAIQDLDMEAFVNRMI